MWWARGSGEEEPSVCLREPDHRRLLEATGATLELDFVDDEGNTHWNIVHIPEDEDGEEEDSKEGGEEDR